MHILLFDDPAIRPHLLPLTFTRPVGDLRCGILTIREKWEWHSRQTVAFITQPYLCVKYPLHIEKEAWLINGAIMPDDNLFAVIKTLPLQSGLYKDDVLIAAHMQHDEVIEVYETGRWPELKRIEYTPAFNIITRPWHIFGLNGEEIHKDYYRLTHKRTSQDISDTNRVLGKENIFIEEGVSMDFAILNATKGPIYIGAGCQVLENSVIRGPFAMLEGGVVKMGAKIYGSTTIGPRCTVGGEINNTVLWGYSNKGHDGFLGNSVLGQWCNLGADTNTSNLKNDYSEVKLWDYVTKRFEGTGMQFCGLIMGDHSKSGINTMFNTGTVVGVNCNIFGSGFPRNFIPSYSWGGEKGFTTYLYTKAYETAKRVMARRNCTLDDTDAAILKYVFDLEQNVANG